MVMAALFQRTGLSFSVSHCNFGLRGVESDGDELFVRHWAESHGIQVYFRQFDTQGTADREGISIQMAARNLRYKWFRELLQNQGFDYLATAHHANDALETTLLNLSRGTGLAGLPGIIPVQGNLIRPLLFATKAQILQFADEEHLEWREDSSNLTDHYQRNLLRHQVIPVLQQLNPSLETTFLTTSQRLQSANVLLKEYLSQWKSQIVRTEDSTLYIQIAAIQNAKEPVFQLHFILDAFGYSYAQTQQIVAALDQISGKIFTSGTHQLIKDRTDLILTPFDLPTFGKAVQVFENTEEVKIPAIIALKIRRLPFTNGFYFSPDRSETWFDEAKIQYPLTVRPWQEGDWFCPFGMNGKRKKVSDLLIDHKVALNQKKNTLVMLDKEQRILWVVGIRADDRFRIDQTTSKIMHVSISK